VYLKGWKVKDL